MRTLSVLFALCVGLAAPAYAQSEVVPAPAPSDGDGLPLSPYAPLVRQHYFELLAKSPWRALGFELLLPGAGNLYTGLYAPAVGTLAVSLAGASMWLAGALRDRPALTWAGIGTFAVGRSYGVISAPVGALLLNAAYRRQLGIVTSF